MQVTYIDHSGTDLTVVNSARVSFDKESDWLADICDCDLDAKDNCELCDCGLSFYLQDRDEKLVNYLAKHEHYSPFNHCYITMRVKAPIFVARQLVKHKFMPWNEVSRRYVDSTPEFYTPEWRSRPSEGIKQGSGGDIAVDEHSYLTARTAALRAYEDLLKQNVAPEQARAILPLDMYTEWYWSGTLKAWFDMYRLRIDAHSQQETQWVAKEVGKILSKLYPTSWEALTNGKD